MKTKHLLLVLVMLMFTALNAIAQNVTDKPNSEKLLPPNLMKNPGNSSQQMMQPDLNKLLMQAIKSHDKNAIKKTLDDYRQQLKDRSNQQALHIPENNTMVNHASSNSNFHLTKDINALAESDPQNHSDIYGNISYAILHHVIYFAADDGIHGNELWRSDGTAAGTFMVKDVEPGIVSSDPHEITLANGKLYFSATTTTYGNEPWVSDGTESGTQLLLDINPGFPSDPAEFVALGNKVYFAANDIDYLDALWETDGTSGGTKLVKQLGVDAVGSYVSQLVEANDLLFFTFVSYITGGVEIWRSDGTDAGTYHIGTNTVFYDFPLQLTNYNSKLYFSVLGAGGGFTLWLTDGTDAGTIPAPGADVINIYADYAFGTPFPVLNNILYIPGYSGSVRNGLYKYDALNSEGITLVKDFTPVADFDYTYIPISEIKIINNTLFFIASGFNYNGDTYDQLWSSKGSDASTKLINKFPVGERVNNLYAASNTLYFEKNGKSFGTELWAVPNTPFGSFPILVSDIFKGATSSYPNYLTAFNGKLFFSATDGVKGNELFMTNGLAFGVTLVKDINTVSTSSSNAGLYIDALTPLGNKVLFNASEKAHGSELYTSDGTASGTFLLNDILPGESGSNPDNMLSKNNFGYFTATSSDSTFCIFKTNGSKNSLQKVVPDYKTNSHFISGFSVANNGLVFYVLFNYNTASYELWRSDGTAAGTFLLSSTVYSGYYLNVSGNTAFFVGGDATYGYELWKSDGSVSGTKMVKNINPGIGNSSPKGMFVYKNEVYFAANNAAGASFWKSDGTEAGTILLRQIDPWYSSTVFSNDRYEFEVSNNILYFSAINYANSKGTELWRTNGTVAGTHPVTDVSPDDDSYYPIPYYLTDVNGTLFFILNNSGVYGTELWKTNGTKEGTRLVKDITSEADASGLNNLTSFGGKLYFTNSGMLWSSDGTADGTTPVDDAGISDVYIYNIVAANNQLFLSGFTQQYGIELYAGKPDATGKFVASKTTNQDAVKTTLPFSAILYPNPVVSNAILQLTGDTKNISISVTDMSGKKLWQSSNINAMLIKLPVEKYTAGTYIVTVTNGIDSKTIKLVKQ